MSRQYFFTHLLWTHHTFISKLFLQHPTGFGWTHQSDRFRIEQGSGGRREDVFVLRDGGIHGARGGESARSRLCGGLVVVWRSNGEVVRVWRKYSYRPETGKQTDNQFHSRQFWIINNNRSFTAECYDVVARGVKLRFWTFLRFFFVTVWNVDWLSAVSRSKPKGHHDSNFEVWWRMESSSWSIDWLIVRSADRLIDRLMDWLIDWIEWLDSSNWIHA